VILAASSYFNTVNGRHGWSGSYWNHRGASACIPAKRSSTMIGMVEGAKRQRTPNEIALTILLVVMTSCSLLARSRCCPFPLYSVRGAKAGAPVPSRLLWRCARLPHPDDDRLACSPPSA